MGRSRKPSEVGHIALRAGIDAMLRGVELCVANKITLSSLVLIYSAIDTLASLSRAPDHVYVEKSDFMNWVGTYLLPNSDIAATPVDLYAARCSVLHTSGPYSKLADEGRARTISYAWGNASLADLNALIERQGREDAVGAHLDQLVGALRAGIDKWKETVLHDETQLAAAMPRSDELYFLLDSEVLRGYLAQEDEGGVSSRGHR